MLRRVAFIKAILAGVGGALAWEVAARIAIWAGLPVFDITKTLGTMLFRPHQPLLWWPVGLIGHCAVGAIWAVFYAYFIWSVWKIALPLQGLAFSFLPTALAGFIMVPQIGFMHPLVLNGDMPSPRLFAIELGWGGPVGIIFGHFVYGVTMGTIYRWPVGTPVKRELAHA